MHELKLHQMWIFLIRQRKRSQLGESVFWKKYPVPRHTGNELLQRFTPLFSQVLAYGLFWKNLSYNVWDKSFGIKSSVLQRC